MAPIPPAAPDPARPMKWPLPMLLANSEAPTWTDRCEFKARFNSGSKSELENNLASLEPSPNLEVKIYDTGMFIHKCIFELTGHQVMFFPARK